MKFAASTVGREDWLKTVRPGLPHYRAFELACAEPRIPHPPGSGELRALRRLREAEQLTYSVHAPFRRLDVGSGDARLRAESVRLQAVALEVAADVGAGVVVMHPSQVADADWLAMSAAQQEAQRGRERAAFEKLQRMAAKLGVRIAIENMPRHRAAWRATWGQQLLAKLDPEWVGATVDVGHAHTAGIAPALMLEAMAPRLVHVHVHDNGGVQDEHRPAGDGNLDWRPVLLSLSLLDYRGLVADETPTHEGRVRGLWRLAYLADRARRVRPSAAPLTP